MTRYVLLLALLLIAFAPQAYAETYQSAFGFTFDVPSHWVAVTKQEIQDNAAGIDTASKSAAFRLVDPRLMEKIADAVTSGSAEIYLNQATASSAFVDNMDIVQRTNRIADDPRYFNAFCPALAEGLTKAFGRSIQVHRCEASYWDKHFALYTEFDGAVQGTRSLQYQIQKAPGKTIVITATAKNHTLGQTRADFERMMRSVRF